MMKENFRLFFCLLWMPSLGCTFAFALGSIVSWGGLLEYFFASLIVLGISTAGAIITSA